MKWFQKAGHNQLLKTSTPSSKSREATIYKKKWWLLALHCFLHFSSTLPYILVSLYRKIENNHIFFQWIHFYNKEKKSCILTSIFHNFLLETLCNVAVYIKQIEKFRLLTIIVGINLKTNPRCSFWMKPILGQK